jgi:LysM repeat protein
MRKNPAAKRTRINQHLNRQTQERHLEMNNQNPLIPQGSALEQKNKGRARTKIAVFLALAINGTFLMALLMQGCGQSKEPVTPTETVPSNPPPAFVETTNPPVTTSSPPVAVTAPAVVEPLMPPAAPAGATEYTIVKGDILDSIAKKFHVSLKALTDANPGIQPTKLKIGQQIHIPAPATPAAPTAAAAAVVETPSAGGEQMYTVKSGDNLTKIHEQFGVSLKALRAANGLKTDRLSVGQKLKIPAKAASAPAAAPATPTEPAPASTTTPTPTTPPGR